MRSPESPNFGNEQTERLVSPREGLQRWAEFHEAIRRADPLGADGIFEMRFPQLNGNRDDHGWARNIDGLVDIAQRIVPSVDTVKSYSLVEARAAKRDLGFIAASLSRPDGKMQFAEGLEPAMLELAAKTGDVPAQTIFDYTAYNPQDTRVRAFTSSYHERTIIKATTNGTRLLTECMRKLDEAGETTISDPQYAQLVGKAAENYGPMAESIFSVKRTFPKHFFGQVIQKNFREVTMGGKRYHGAGGGQIPVFLIDKMLGNLSSDIAEEKAAIQSFQEENLFYSPPEIRRFAQSLEGKKSSLIEAAEREVQSLEENDVATARESLEALSRMREEIFIFRARHGALAKADMEGREEKVGTGGHGIQMLKLLEKLTKSAGNRLDEAIDRVD